MEPAGALIGRERAVEEIGARVLAAPGVTTLLGPAGVGKTSLALGVLGEVGARFPGGGIFVGLSGATHRDEIAAALAEAFCGGRPGADFDRALSDLQLRPAALLVLDNLEQVVDDAAEIVGQLLRANAELRVLATSRVALRIGGEQRYEVPSLSEDDAAALFEARVREHDPKRRFDADEAALLPTLVRRLDQMPLAVELAAARAGLMGLSQMLARLDDRFALLRSRRRDLPARQQSLIAALEWSWQLLDDEERRALRACAVFRGGFEIDAADALLGGDSIERVEALRDSSWLQPVPDAPQPRFRLLESVREFVAERSELDAEGEAAAARHAQFFTELAESLRERIHPHGDAAALERVGRELEDFAAAQRYAVEHDAALAIRLGLALAEPLASRGPLTLRLLLLERALEACGAEASTPERCRLLILLGSARADAGAIEAAMRDLESAAELARELGNRVDEADILCTLGSIALDSGDRAEAERYTREGLEVARAGEARIALMKLLNNLALLEAGAERFDAARRAYEEAIEVASEGGAPRAQAIILYNLGELELAEGDIAAAEGTLARAQQVATAGGGDFIALAVRLKRMDLALASPGAMLPTHELDAAVAAGEALGDPRLWALAYCHRAAVRARGGSLELADEDLGRADAQLASGHDRDCADTLTLTRALLDVARARDCRAADGEAARALLEAVQRCHDEVVAAARADGMLSAHIRICAGRLRAELEAEGAPGAAPELQVGEGGRWFQCAGEARVDLRRRRRLAAVLEALTQRRLEAPGEVMDLDALQAAGWPGEEILPQAAQRRVYVAIGTLRELGLRDALQTAEGGYLLDPSLVVRRATEI